jgi:hypothetical protein
VSRLPDLDEFLDNYSDGKIVSEKAEAYMSGWKYGYHNATMAQERRIIKIIKETAPEKIADQIIKRIKESRKAVD